MINLSELWFELDHNKFVRSFGDWKVTATYIEIDGRRQFHFEKGKGTYDYFNNFSLDVSAEEMDNFCEECLEDIQYYLQYDE